jgi:hypothetical protein
MLRAKIARARVELPPRFVPFEFGPDRVLGVSYAPSLHDGHGQTLMVIDVDSGELQDVIRLGRTPGARIKALDARAAYGLRRGRDCASLVERYSLPDLPCSADPGASQPRRGTE